MLLARYFILFIFLQGTCPLCKIDLALLIKHSKVPLAVLWQGPRKRSVASPLELFASGACSAWRPPRDNICHRVIDGLNSRSHGQFASTQNLIGKWFLRSQDRLLSTARSSGISIPYKERTLSVCLCMLMTACTSTLLNCLCSNASLTQNGHLPTCP